jgi:hypothetical protein
MRVAVSRGVEPCSLVEVYCSGDGGTKNKTVRFGEKVTVTKFTDLRTVLGSSFGNVKFRDHLYMIFEDTYRIIRPVEGFR